MINRERTITLNSQCLTLRNLDARIFILEASYRIFRSVGQNNGGITLASESCKKVVTVVSSNNVHAIECNGSTVGNGKLPVFVVLARYYIAIHECELCLDIREVANKETDAILARIVSLTLEGQCIVTQIKDRNGCLVGNVSAVECNCVICTLLQYITIQVCQGEI